MEENKTTNNTETSEEQMKHPGGRPLKFATVQELDVAIQGYFDLCDPHVEKRMVDGGVNQKGETIWIQREVLTEQKPYTMSGLARALGMDRRSLLNYANRDEFFPSIQAAKDHCEEYWEGRLDSPYANGAKFNLANNYQGKYQPWADKQEIDHTSAGQGFFTRSKLEIEVVEDTKTEDQPDSEDSASAS